MFPPSDLSLGELKTYCAREVVKRRIIVMCVLNCTSFLIFLDAFFSSVFQTQAAGARKKTTREASCHPTNHQAADMNQQCKVCGEPAAGFHFGAFTCEGCKVSFYQPEKNSPRFTIKVGDHRRERQTALTTAGRLTVSGCELASLKHN
jgi:hypothetical protein